VADTSIGVTARQKKRWRDKVFVDGGNEQRPATTTEISYNVEE
jgi:hypothetical protein